MKSILKETGYKIKKNMRKIWRKSRKKWNRIQYRKKTDKKLFEFAKIFLEKGIYYISHENKVIERVDKHTFIRNLFRLHFLVKNQNCPEPIFQVEKVESIEFENGFNKIVLFNNDCVYGLYESTKRYFKSKEVYQKYSSLFNYPSVKENFIDRYQCVIMNRVRGISFCDENHTRFLLKKLFEYAISAPIKKDPVYGILYLQHGDAKYLNVLWNDETFLFVDLDDIGFYPPLFDVLHYLVTLDELVELNKIIALLNENREELKAICKKIEIDVEDNPLDTLFYDYCYKLKERHEEFSFLTIENTAMFPKTNKFLRSINNRNPETT